MNTNMDNYLLNEMKYGNDFAYILENNNSFISTEYKVLKSLEKKCFLRCMKTMYNGKVQLYYLNDFHKTLEELKTNITFKELIILMENIFENVIEIKSNGFLLCNGINASLDKIL